MFRRQKRLRDAFRAVRAEFDEHLDAINNNTEELFENRAMILELQERICKLGDRVAQISAHLDDASYPSIELSVREQEVFVALFTQQTPVDYASLSRRLSLPISSVQDVIFEIIRKGVPVLKRRDESGRFLISLDIEFAELQSKHKIVNIDENIQRRLGRHVQSSLIE